MKNPAESGGRGVILGTALIVCAVAQIVIAYTQIVIVLTMKRLWSSQRYLIERGQREKFPKSGRSCDAAITALEGLAEA